MGRITLRPELMTPGGQAASIMLDDCYVGSFTMVYRENDALWGTIQLDEEMLEPDEKGEIDLFMHEHIEDLIEALQVRECMITSTYSDYDYVISTDDIVEEMIEEEEWVEGEEAQELHLSVVRETRHRVEYQIHDENHEVVAEAVVYKSRDHVTGEVLWDDEPTEAEMDTVARLIMDECDDEEVESFSFVMYVDGEEIATIELTRDDPIEEEITGEEVELDIGQIEGYDFTFDLIREEMDLLIYHIYEETDEERIYLGTATADLSDDDATVLVEFENPRDRRLREQIVYHLIDELEEEAYFDTVTITMQYDDEVIDEYHFDYDDQPEYGLLDGLTTENRTETTVSS
ncbi:hypothetical protein CathTA2_0847 [Caldalkalibacillus thermarum TA2.A1]|uniref:Uncharacterized protein n=1 Tax=Caldalkalibacillus thermarum (strain TA2.A1) TaxID=986075 RepID=F5L4Y4_CALTT|nr:hypothetical protein [Caldalkalibacillus thermarum]EGL83597.1 hypothetical protein CathTA2_0847 [Caldalkalibacillus thermarum TA2.A1]